MLGDVDALHIVDGRFHRDADVGLGNAVGGIGQDVERTREAKVARIVGAERNLDAALSIDHSGVFDEVAVEGDGAVGGHGTEELCLKKTDVVLVDVYFREHVLEHRSQNVARVDDFVHARGALALDDGLGFTQRFAINLLRHGFVYRNGENELARFFGSLDVVFEKRHFLDAPLLEKLWSDVAQRKSELVVLLIAVEIAVAQVAGFFCRDDFFHQDHGGIVFARIFRAFGAHHGGAHGKIGGFEPHDERVAAHCSRGKTLIAHAAHHHTHVFVQRQGETPRCIGLHAVAPAFGCVVEHIDKRDSFSTFGIDHASHQALG